MKYYNDPRMHVLGNHGMGGRLHALLAPAITAYITLNSYSGFEPRTWLHAQLPDAQCVDLGCGVGISTRTGDLGIDTSTEMILHAAQLYPNKNFRVGNAENFVGQFEAATFSFVLHEMPQLARLTALKQALIMTPSVFVMDIHPSYKPSEQMLFGEPYLPHYLKHVDRDVEMIAQDANANLNITDLIPEHVRVWHLTRELL